LLPVRFAIVALGSIFLLGCGREPLAVTIDDDTTAQLGDGGSPADAAKRTPRKHRAAGSSCPSARGVAQPPMCAPGAGAELPVDCLQDSDCTAGANGRCVRAFGPARCGGVCSYDACAGDSDCGGSEPCLCRASSTELAANSCVTGSNCRVDADCGVGGFCSPSVVNPYCACVSTKLCDDSSHCYAGKMEVPCACGDACGHGYYCHTAQDECVDDEDCRPGTTCNYDRLEKRWTCAWCLPYP
jgi:hypothetical protein